MKRCLLLLMGGLGVLSLSAQVNNNRLAVAVHAALPVYAATGDPDGVLWGVSLQKQWTWSKHFAATASVGYQHFSGTIRNNMDGREDKDFASIPLLAGLRYYTTKGWYLAFETGAAVKAHSNMTTKWLLVPAAGVLLPVRTRALDLGLQFSTVPMGYGYPEQKLLQRGGYSFLGMRVAWVF